MYNIAMRKKRTADWELDYAFLGVPFDNSRMPEALENLEIANQFSRNNHEVRAELVESSSENEDETGVEDDVHIIDWLSSRINLNFILLFKLFIFSIVYNFCKSKYAYYFVIH